MTSWLRRLLGLSREEDPLEREIKEMRRLAKRAAKLKIEKRKAKTGEELAELLEGVFPEQ